MTIKDKIEFGIARATNGRTDRTLVPPFRELMTCGLLILAVFGFVGI